MSKINAVPEKGDNNHTPIKGDELINERFNPKTGVRLTPNVVYYFPDREDFDNGRGFYSEKPQDFTDKFYGIYLNFQGNTTPVPLGIFYRDRTSVSGKVADFDGNLKLIIKPKGFISDIVKAGIGGSLKDLANAIIGSGFVGFKVTKVIEVPTRKYGTKDEISPREVYTFEGVKA